MKKIDRDLVFEKFNSRTIGFNETSRERSFNAAIIDSIVSSINENIDESYAGRTVLVDQEKVILTLLADMSHPEFERGTEFECINDRKGELKCVIDGKTFYIPKEWMRLK